MQSTRRRASAAWLGWTFLPATALAQVPAHATLLNPTQAMAGPVLTQLADDVHALAPTAYAHSGDGGRTWPLREQSFGMQSLTDLAATPTRVVIAGVTTNGNPAVVVSTDGGASWSAQHAISTLPATQVHVCVDGLVCVALWIGTSGSGRVWTSRSGDGGLTWSSPATQLNAPPVLANAAAVLPTLIAEGATVHAFWGMFDSAWTTQQQVSTDGGLTWLPQARILPIAAGTAITGTPAELFAAQGSVQRSLDGGLTWPTLVVPGIATSRYAVAKGGVLLVTGTGSGPVFSYVVNVSANGGASWLASPYVVPSFSGFAPVPHVVGSDLYVEFLNPLNPALNAVIHSANGGVGWRVLQTGLMACAPGPARNVHVVMTTSSTSGMQYHAYVGAGHTPLGGGGAGAGGITPVLAMARVPLLGNTTSFTVAAAVGGSVGVLGLATAAPLAVPWLGGTLWLQGPLVTASFTTNGMNGAPGAGRGVVPLVVPTTPALAGAHLTAQAVVLDASAAGGLALTGGCEVWLR